MSEIWNLSALCRCCHKDGQFRSLRAPHTSDGSVEIYADLLCETFGITMLEPQIEASYSICDECIQQLRAGARFKRQVLVCESKFKEYCKNEQMSTTEFIKIEVEQIGNDTEHIIKTEIDSDENDDDDIDSSNPLNFEDDNELDLTSDDEDSDMDTLRDKPLIELPLKSREKYWKCYENFILWKEKKNATSFSESVFLEYFDELSRIFKSATLWATYSMLKSTLNSKHNVNMKEYNKLTALLRELSGGYKSKSSTKVLTAENVNQFLNEAPDHKYLATKVALIFGVNGACRSVELTYLTTNCIEEHNQMLLIKLPDTKTESDRAFVIREESLDIVKKYQALRPKNVDHNRFFLNYQNGKCTTQPIGRNKVAAMPKKIAIYLNLPDAESYTGLCFRNTSKTLLAATGLNSTSLIRPEELSGKKSQITKMTESTNLSLSTEPAISSSEDEDSDIDTLTSPETQEMDKPLIEFPLKSREKYRKCYESFILWKEENNLKSFSESVFLAYFNEISQIVKPATLWVNFSMLKSTMISKHNINIKAYRELIALLRRLSDGYKSRKFKVLTAENVDEFLNEAPDDKYLATKVALIFGVNGACRNLELTYLTTNYIEEHNQMLLIKLPDTKTKGERAFVVRDESLAIVKKYQALRPENVEHNRFFLNYHKGKCTKQPIGRHKVAGMSKEIAIYLNLPDAESYTGNCLRNTSKALLAATGLNSTLLNRSGGEKSYNVEDSVVTKSRITDVTESSNLLCLPTEATISASDDEDSDMDTLTSPQTQKKAKPLIELPLKSREKYWRSYESFILWKEKNNVKSFSESVFLEYFNEISQTVKPSTLWANYSMLKSTMIAKHNIIVKDYKKLTALLRRLSDGYKCKKTKVLTAENVDKFLNEAPDHKYLATKVALIFGVNGACQSVELTYLTTNCIEEHNQMLLIKLPDAKTESDRAFVVRDESLDIVKKYQALRPKNVAHNRFFLNYQNGKCTTQPIGKHKVAAMPKEIAIYLNLPNPESYTGKCFRNTSKTLLASTGFNLTSLICPGGGKSNKVEDSIGENSQINKISETKITESTNLYLATEEIAISSSEDEDNDMDALTSQQTQEMDKPLIELPLKSREKYWKCYENFMLWKEKKKAKSFSEGVFLEYFNEVSRTLKPSTLFTNYSMLKSTMFAKQNININDYGKLTALLKNLSDGYKCKKTKVLTADNVDEFLNEAPDHKYLATKVALIFGVNGACRSLELVNLTTNCIEEHNQMLLIKLPHTTTKGERAFVVRDESFNVIKKYQALRPKNVEHDRFFVNYHNGKCTTQPIGRHKVAAMPKEIAIYLNLPDAESYTGQCFRITSKTLLAATGLNLTSLKRPRGEDSNKAEDSVGKKSQITKLTESTNLFLPTETTISSSEDEDNDTLASPQTQQKANSLMELPLKSREKYWKCYESFILWKENNNAESFSESVFLEYFNDISHTVKPSTLWANYSMLKSTMISKHDINIKAYRELTALLKKMSDGYKSKKSNVFTAQNVNEFLNEAPDYKYLATKIALIFGVNGACRCLELTNLSTDCIEQHNKMLLIKLPDAKTKGERAFVIRDETLDLVKAYQALRPETLRHNRFFVNYNNGKCTTQPIGNSKFAGMAKEIAIYLKLPNPEAYTGNCFRSTSKALLAASGPSSTSLKRPGGTVEDAVRRNKIGKTESISTDGTSRPSTSDGWMNLT